MARPEKPINWDEVELALEAGNSARQIATRYRMHVETFYDKFKKNYDCNFTDFHYQLAECGKANIELTQYTKALEGNTQLLLWLGQVKGGQKLPDAKPPLPPNDDKLDEIITSVKEKDLSNAPQQQTNPELPASDQTL